MIQMMKLSRRLPRPKRKRKIERLKPQEQLRLSLANRKINWNKMVSMLLMLDHNLLLEVEVDVEVVIEVAEAAGNTKTDQKELESSEVEEEVTEVAEVVKEEEVAIEAAEEVKEEEEEKEVEEKEEAEEEVMEDQELPPDSMPMEIQSSQPTIDKEVTIQVTKLKSTVVMIERTEPVEVETEEERKELENSMKDKDQTNSTRRRMLKPLRAVRQLPLKTPELQLRKRSKRNTRK